MLVSRQPLVDAADPHFAERSGLPFVLTPLLPGYELLYDKVMQAEVWVTFASPWLWWSGYAMALAIGLWRGVTARKDAATMLLLILYGASIGLTAPLYLPRYVFFVWYLLPACSLAVLLRRFESAEH